MKWLSLIALCLLAVALIWLAPRSQTGCTVGDTYFVTDAPAGQNWFLCAEENTWTVQ